MVFRYRGELCFQTTILRGSSTNAAGSGVPVLPLGCGLKLRGSDWESVVFSSGRRGLVGKEAKAVEYTRAACRGTQVHASASRPRAQPQLILLLTMRSFSSFGRRFWASLLRIGRGVESVWNWIRPLPLSVADELRRCELHAYFAEGSPPPKQHLPAAPRPP